MFTDCIRPWESRHQQCQSWPLQRFPWIMSNKRNLMRTIETTQAMIAPRSAHAIIFLSRAKLQNAPLGNQGGYTWYARCASSGATGSSSNCNYLLQDSVGLSTLLIMLEVSSCSYGSLTRLYVVSGYAMIQVWLPNSFVYWWAVNRKWSGNRRLCDSSD